MDDFIVLGKAIAARVIAFENNEGEMEDSDYIGMTKMLSHRVMMKLNVYKTVKEKLHVTCGIRPFFMNAEGEPRMMKKEGVSLSFAELSTLAMITDSVNLAVNSGVVPTTYHFLGNSKELAKAKKAVEEFYLSASYGKRARFILQKTSNLATVGGKAEGHGSTSKADDDLGSTGTPME